MPASRGEPELETPPVATTTYPAFGERTPWTAGAAVVFALLCLGIAIGAAMLAQPLHERLVLALASGRNAVLVGMMLTLVVMQAVMVGLVWWGAARFGGDRAHVLSLAPRLPLRDFLVGLAGLAALIAPYNLLIYLVWPEEFASDLRPFWDLARSPAVWLAAIVVVLGAPMAEELLFRGFLLPALTKTRFGLAGATMMTSAGWTALHSYSLFGTVEILMIGAYFAWLMFKYENLWLPMAVHAFYNGAQLATLALWPTG